MNPHLHCVFDLEDNKPIFLHEILVYDNTPAYQILLQKIERLISRRYQLDKT